MYLARFPLVGVLANIGSRLYAGIATILAAPFYLQYLGLENYGLIGVFNTITAIAFLLDLGLSATMTRELARSSTYRGIDKKSNISTTVRTIEILSWALSMIAGAALWMIAPFLARYWIVDASVDGVSVVTALQLMAIIVAFQLPIGVYSGALVGINKISLMSVISAGATTVRHAGGLLTLEIFGPSAITFFAWYATSTAMTAVVMRWFVHRPFHRDDTKGRFDITLLRHIFRFATGMGVISILSTVSQITDKIILARVVGLVEFGLYTLCVTIASVLHFSASAVYSSAVSRITSANERSAHSELDLLFRTSSDTLCILTIPIAAVMITGAEQCLFLMSGNASLAADGIFVFLLISSAALIGAIAWLPYMMIVGAGITKPIIRVYLMSATFLVPITIYLSLRAGSIGAAISVMAFQIFNLLSLTMIASAKHLVKSSCTWLFCDIFGSTLVGILAAWLAKGVLLGSGGSRVYTAVGLWGCYLATLGAVGFFFAVRRRHSILMMFHIFGPPTEEWRVR